LSGTQRAVHLLVLVVVLLTTSSPTTADNAPKEWLGNKFPVVWPPSAYHGRPLPALDRLFHRTDGWTGGDGVYSVRLAPTRVLWLFSDSFVGSLVDGNTRRGSTMIHNAVAIQDGDDPMVVRPRFYYRTTKDGKPASFIDAPDGRGFVWIYAGAMTTRGLYFFLIQIEPTSDVQAFGFRSIGMWLAHVADPSGSPSHWRITTTRVPGSVFTSGLNRIWGSAMLEHDGFIYVYGTDEELPATATTSKRLIVARAPVDHLGDFAQWRYRCGNAWVDDPARVTPLTSGMANEFSVTYSKEHRDFVMVLSESGLSSRIVRRRARHPWGPWDAPRCVFEVEMPVPPPHQLFTYAGKAHAVFKLGRHELVDPDEMVVSYVINSCNFADLINDATLYRPRFVACRLWP